MFRDSLERRHFLKLLAHFEERFAVQVHVYCLMTNHFHLLVRSEDGALSEAMQHLSGNFTRWVNHRRSVDGPVFRGRFHSVPVVEPDHLHVLCRYIHRNPVGAVPPDDLARYPWSSLPAYLGLRASPAWLRRVVVLEWFGGDTERLADFVLTDECRVDEPPWLRTLPTLTTAEIGRGESGASAEDQCPGELLTGLEATLAQLRGVPPADLHRTGPGARDHARLLVVLLARDELGVGVDDLARFYGVTASYVRSAATRARKRARTDSVFADSLRRLREAA